ncbi:MAG: hypothetical protein EBU85_08170 [Actinobacteria bacterium]|nr:hypothetical protein [Actinomycetota bacterium]
MKVFSALPQTVVPPEEVILTVGVTNALTVMVMALLVAVDGDAHSALLESTQVTTSPLVNPALV